MKQVFRDMIMFLAGGLSIMLIFMVLYNFQLHSMAVQDCQKSLNEANRIIEYCSNVIVDWNLRMGNFSKYNFTNFSVS